LDINPTDGVFFMTKHSDSFKLEVVRRYLAGPLGHKALAKKYGVGRNSIVSWVNSYKVHGPKGLHAKRKSYYSAEFKLNVLRQAKLRELSNTQAATLFDLRGGAGVVALWRRQYDEGGPQSLHPKPRGRPPMKPPKRKSAPATPAQTDDKRSLQELLEENEQLRTEVAYLKKLAALVRANRQAVLKRRRPSSN
jgi:transposase